MIEGWALRSQISGEAPPRFYSLLACHAIWANAFMVAVVLTSLAPLMATLVSVAVQEDHSHETG